MKELANLLSSAKTTFVLLALYATGLAAATFLEKNYGTTLAQTAIYYSPLFFLLQALLAGNFILTALRNGWLKSRRWGMLLIHFSFVIILLGALITHLFGREGTIRLREGQPSNRMEVRTNHQLTEYLLPFRMELVKFTLKRYPGSMSPSSYESDLRVYADGDTLQALIYMNNVLDIKGYRFFQASFDTDERGTILSVNRDVAGRNVTYAGYLSLLVGCILSLTGRNGRIRTLYRRMNARKKATTLFLLAAWVVPSALTAAPTMKDVVQRSAVPPEHAAQFGALAVQATNGRIIPLNTFASEILRKLHKGTHFGSLNADRFLLSVLAMPEMWMRTPLITCSNDEITSVFGLSRGECAYIEVFDEEGEYKLQRRLDEAYSRMPAERTAFDKDLIKLDERIHVFHLLLEGELLRLFPNANDPEGKWYAHGDDLSGYSGQDSMFVAGILGEYLSEVREALASGDWSKANEWLGMMTTYQQKKGTETGLDNDRLTLELKYNRLNVFHRCKVGYLALGGCLLLFSFLLFFRERRWAKWAIRLLGVGVLLVFHFHMLGMGMRWRIGGHAPWSNSYETMVYVAWATVFAGLLFMRRSPVTFALATLFAGIILFVSELNWMDPQISPLAPVLKSPWLMFHVAVLMAAYGFFGISFLIGLTNLSLMSCKPKERLTEAVRELSVVNELSLLVGLLLMTVGTFMGAVWANESWGRYWGWDPKETWALITIIVYVMTTHLRLLKERYNLWLFNLCSVVAFASVLMTYFGVNYFLSGMHSYGENEHAGDLFVGLIAAAVLITLLALTSLKGRRIR
ncbi:MAG: cytochrome c biogenesis protein CcsA [Tannerella sp.]|nr:cytochrome c biogenesis protein CcsA [Tannerella sp.]